MWAPTRAAPAFKKIEEELNNSRSLRPWAAEITNFGDIASTDHAPEPDPFVRAGMAFGTPLSLSSERKPNRYCFALRAYSRRAAKSLSGKSAISKGRA